MKIAAYILFLCMMSCGCLSDTTSVFYSGEGKHCFRASIRPPIWDAVINQFRIDYRIENTDSKERELGAIVWLVGNDEKIIYSNPSTGEAYTNYEHRLFCVLPPKGAIYGSFFISGIKADNIYGIECKYYAEDQECFDIIESPMISINQNNKISN